MGSGFFKQFLSYTLICAFLFESAKGDFDDPPIEAIENGLPGIRVENKNIFLEENVGRDLGTAFKLARFRLTQPGDTISKSGGDDRFYIQEDENGREKEWVLYVSSYQDYELLPNPDFPLVLISGADVEVVTVRVEDVNDNAPRLVKMDPDPIPAIKEIEAHPAPIVTLNAVDDDVKDTITFTLTEEGKDSDYFEIDSNGQVHMKKPLNYTIKSSHRLEIVMSDNRDPFYKTPVGVTILVQDLPNRPPEFTRPPIIRAIEENTPKGTSIFTVQARDGDYGLNWGIEYTLEDTLDLLEIDLKTGEITVKSEIDAEAPEIIAADFTHSVTIIATEESKPEFPNLPPEATRTSEVVTFTITDANDQSPLLCDVDGENCKASDTFTFSIDESHIGQIPLDKVIRVIDLDSTTRFNTFTLDFADDTDEIIKKAFTITPTRGSRDETFSLSVLTQNRDWIDAENADLNGFWENEQTFTIEVTETMDETHKAYVTVKARVKDINDKNPSFDKQEYEFYVCENAEDGSLLRVIEPDTNFPNSCPFTDLEPPADLPPVKVYAEDLDVSPEYGQASVIYRWSQSTRVPPVVVGSKDGSMTMNTKNGNFDYERLQNEVFILEAVDSEGATGALIDSVAVTFRILDRNDVTVDLRFTNGTQATILEGTPMDDDEFVLNGIIASDVDTKADVALTMEVSGLFAKVEDSSSLEYKRIFKGLEDDMKSWFKLVFEPDSTTGTKNARIVLGDILPDREADPVGSAIDRVDLIITAEDLGSETGSQTVSQRVTIFIQDINDNPPKWVEDGTDLNNIKVVETEEWGDEGDQETPYMREIHTFRATDPDTDTVFEFGIECEEDDDVCGELKDLFEIIPTIPGGGNAVLRRQQGKLIDRESPLINDNDDKISLTITVSDGKNRLESKIQITVEDRNDNIPIFSEKYDEKTYTVPEDVAKEEPFAIILATDRDHPDRFGKVSYLLVDEGIEGDASNGMGKFNISLTDGKLTPVPGEYDWFEIKSFKIRVKAIDYYRPSAQSGSNSNYTFINIDIIDKNDHAPEFLTPEDTPIDEVNERVPDSDKPFKTALRIRDKDDPSKPNGQITVQITDVKKEPTTPNDPSDLKALFKLGNPTDAAERNVKEVEVLATRNFTGLWGTYTIELEASDGADSDGGQLSSTASYTINIINENLNAPEFIYPEDNSTSIYISIVDAVPGETLIDYKDNKREPVPNIYAEDKDKGSGRNGQVSYSLLPYDDNKDCVDVFSIANVNGAENITGMITLKEQLSEDDANKQCDLMIEAKDLGDPAQRSNISFTVRLLLNKNTPPTFSESTITVPIKENTTGEFAVLSFATDEDIENQNPLVPDDQIYYMLKGGDKDVFDLTVRDEENENGKPRRIPILTPKSVLDYEEIKSYKLTLYVTNNPDEERDDKDPDEVDPEDKQWMVVEIEVQDIKDTAPQFVKRDLITGGFSQITKTGDIISSVVVYDPDLEDPVTITVTSNFVRSDSSLPQLKEPFELIKSSQPNTVGIALKFDPQPSYKGYFEFQLTATDTVGMKDVAKCRMYMVTEKNILKFYFITEMEYVKENQDMLSEILSQAFSYRCNIDRVIEDAVRLGQTTVETHFINLEENLPILADYIKQQQYNPTVYRNLTSKLQEGKFILAPDGIGGAEEPADDDNGQLVTYILIGGVGVLVVALLILGATCYYNNRSLQRRVRALTATTFGSQKSDLNRLGVHDDAAPNTNAFAVEGSNPIWTTEGDARKLPAFDAESVGSGGSVLIGAEDEDYFQKSRKNPMFQAEDIVANYYGSDNDDDPERGSYNYRHSSTPSYNGGDQRQSYDYDDQPRSYNNDYSSGKERFDESPFSSKTTRNPLMNLGGDDNNKSIDVDAINLDDGYGFEENTDVTLF